MDHRTCSIKIDAIKGAQTQHVDILHSTCIHTNATDIYMFMEMCI